MSQPELSHTPNDVAIAARRLQFSLAKQLATDWHGDDPFRTAFSNAMSILFPLGEQFFIDSVRCFSDRIEDPKLKREIRGFIGQEANHRREHQRYNEQLCAARGYDLEELERPLRRRLRWVRKHFSTQRQLAGTVASEHFTAILADGALRDPDVLGPANPDIAALWRWHAVEETEHKAVAYDVYRAVGGKAYMRRRAMLITTIFLFKDIFHGVYLMLKADGRHHNLKIWLRGLNYLFGRPGILRRQWRSYLHFFRKDFHPWQHDNRELVRQWVARERSNDSPELQSVQTPAVHA